MWTHYRIQALASDYDETLARHGQLADTTIRALERLRSTGRKVLLVTGRELQDLIAVCPRLDLFDRIVAENGALLYDPATRITTPLADAPPSRFVEELRHRGVSPLFTGRVIVATLRPFETEVRDTLSAMSLPLQIILNKDALMILPPGVDKASGLRHAEKDLGLSVSRLCAVGDAENDLVFLKEVGFPAAVANALPSVRSLARFVSVQEAGWGVEELIARIITHDAL